jgi:hypothetical protein
VAADPQGHSTGFLSGQHTVRASGQLGQILCSLLLDSRMPHSCSCVALCLLLALWLSLTSCLRCAHTHIVCRRRYFTCALKHAQELAEQVKITSKRDKAGTVEMQEQVWAGGHPSVCHRSNTHLALWQFAPATAAWPQCLSLNASVVANRQTTVAGPGLLLVRVCAYVHRLR